MDIATFSGVASGIQWRDMVDAIMDYEARPLNRMAAQQTAGKARAEAWKTFGTRVSTLQSAAAALTPTGKLGLATTMVASRTSTVPLGASAATGTAPGAYVVDVVSLAQAEKLGGSAFASRTAARGITGDLVINGKALAISASDSLDRIAQRFNDLNTGTSPSGVSAAVLATGSGSYRLVLTSTAMGSAGISLKDATGTALRDLGLVDAATETKHATADGARSDAFAARDRTIASLLGLTGPLPSANVTIGTNVVAIDLDTDTLDSIAASINTLDPGSASVVEQDGAFRLSISGTTRFVEDGGVLETLGVLSATRTSVAQTLTSATWTDQASGLAATAGTLLTSLVGAGVQLGDELALAGTRADGSTFRQTITVAADTDLGDVLSALNASSAFGADAAAPLRPTATAAISNGAIVVTDGEAGVSRLGLSLTASSPATGELRALGTVTVSEGRARVLTAGQDAVLRVDGAYVTRGSNQVTDAIPGVTLDLRTTGTADLTINRDTNSATAAINGFVTAYNDLSAWVAAQSVIPESGVAPPLYADGSLRAMLSTLRGGLNGQVAPGVAGSYTRLADIGITVDRYGKFNTDASKLSAALGSNLTDVQKLFSALGSPADPAVSYVSATAATQPGLYDVNITSGASAVSLTRTIAPYVRTGTDDRLVIEDVATGRKYGIALTDGMTGAQMATALRTEFATPAKRVVQSLTGLTLAADGSAATLTTRLSDLAAETPIAAGHVITISGRQSNGVAFSPYSYAVRADDTVQSLLSAIQQQLGGDVLVELDGGRIRATAAATGATSFDLGLRHEAATGAPTFSGFEIAVEGRAASALIAEHTGDDFTIRHGDLGSAFGFVASYTGGVLGDPLGMAGRWVGADVAGTINGEAGTGSGSVLTGKSGNAAEGLAISYLGAGALDTTVRFSRGIGSLVEEAAKLITADAGRIDAITEALDERIQSLDRRADTIEQRLETRRQQLIRQFTAMEQAMSRFQSQSSWLTQQMAQFEKKD